MKPLYSGLHVGYFNGHKVMSLALRSLFSVYLILCISIGFDDKWINSFQGILWSDSHARLAINVFQLSVEVEQLEPFGRLS